MGKTTLRFGLFLLLFSGVMGCGGTTSVRDHPPSPDVQKAASEYISTEQLILSESFDGALVVHFEHAASSAIAEVREIAAAHGVELRRMSEASPEEVDRRREELEYLSGKRLADFNAVFSLPVEDAAQAVTFYRAIRDIVGEKQVYPRLKGELASLTTTPDLTGLQGYLYPLSTHGGLDARAAWGRGVDGSGVVVVDGERGWNFDHEDISILPLRSLGPQQCQTPQQYTFCPESINHGTGVGGIIAGVNNSGPATQVMNDGNGVTGLAPSVDLIGAGEDGGLSTLESLLFRSSFLRFPEGLPPGTIYVVEVAPSTPESLPNEVYRVAFDRIVAATAAGITVIIAAGNGDTDLNQQYYPWQVNMTQNDSGAIMVGGSWGGILFNEQRDRERWPLSNHGSRVDLFAWASGIVTTGFIDPSHDYRWMTELHPNGPTPPNTDPNAQFINNFGGTSSATAMIAGVAALLQSHAKTQMVTNGNPKTRYLMPDRMKQLLVASGTPQTGGGGNIGVQPDTGVALTRFDTFWTQEQQQYPELTNNTRLTEARMLQLRRNEGIGLECGRIERHVIVGDRDPSCPEVPEVVLWPPNNSIAKTLDIDGDGRADLVRAKNGEWKLDLSSRASTTGAADNFGSWDVAVRFPRITGTMGVWPYTEDMNADGRSDIVVYDKEHATWYVKFTDFALLDNASWNGWDRIIDYSATGVADTREMDPWRSQYCRPHPGDYDGDGLIDLSIACSDGVWRIAYNTESHWNGVTQGSWDREFQYLDADRLAAAPGWAYVTAVGRFIEAPEWPMYKVPDGVRDAQKMVLFAPRSFALVPDWMQGYYGGNESIPLVVPLYQNTRVAENLSFKTVIGSWQIGSDVDAFDTMHSVSPDNVYGGNTCHPIAADFDGDDFGDRAVMCPDEWKIAYTGNAFESEMDADEVRRISLQYQITEFVLPGRSYSGGISYAQALQLIDLAQQLHPNDPPPIPVDMVTSNVCLFPQLCE